MTNPASPNTLTGLEYDYMIKDHLGNVRMLVTEELKTDAYPVASMELAQSATEDQFYTNIGATRDGKPPGYPTDTYTNPNDKVAKVRGDGNKIGPSILLKVMAGDRFNIRANAWWTGTATSTQTSPLSSIVSALITGAPTASGGKIGVAELTSTILDPQVTSFLTSQPFTSGKPKAYLNWILFDERFKLVATSSGAEQVDGSGVFKTYNKTNMPAEKNGYLYIYLSNETNYDVLFDNLQVTHVRGSLLEESHYYPFGLTMAGISSKALAFGGPENKYKFNGGTELAGKEFSDGSGLDLYDTYFRRYDPQIGRFHQIDPLLEIANDWTPYAFCNNNPLLYTDPLGLFTEDPKETSTAAKPKELGGVTVVGVKNHPVPPPSGLNVGSPATSGLDARITPLGTIPQPTTTTPAATPTSTPTATPTGDPLLEPIKVPSFAPALARIGGTVLAVITPTYGGLASGDLNHHQLPKPLLNPLPNPNPWSGHGNDRRNTNPHIVYEFSFTPTDPRTPVLKYGVSDEYRWGMDRPEGQLAGLKALYGPSVTYRILTRTLNRDQALRIEQKLVDVHQLNYGERPRAQIRPLPSIP